MITEDELMHLDECMAAAPDTNRVKIAVGKMIDELLMLRKVADAAKKYYQCIGPTPFLLFEKALKESGLLK